MANRVHFDEDFKTRSTMSLTNIDFIAYNQWKASAKREKS